MGKNRTLAPALRLVSTRAPATAASESTGVLVQPRVRRRLLHRVAQDSMALHLTVPAGPRGWQPFGPGLKLKVLHEAHGILSYLVRLAPGAALPAHRHPVDEECVVLEGQMHLGDRVIGPGTYHLGRKGILHARLHSPGGALIFLRGAVPDPSHLL